MRLDEQPGETAACRGGGADRAQATARHQKRRNRAVVTLQPAGNSAMMQDALAAAMGKNATGNTQAGVTSYPTWVLHQPTLSF